MNPSARGSRITFDEPGKVRGFNPPPAYGDESNSSLALPISRLSESSRSDGSLGDHVYATTTTHTVSTTTTFFRLPRRKKNKGPLFPLPVKSPPLDSAPNANFPPRASISERPSESPHRPSPSQTLPLASVTQAQGNSDNNGLSSPLPSPGHNIDASLRNDSATFAPSNSASTTTGSPIPFGKAARTKGSLRQAGEDDPLPTPPLSQSGRTSTSTGRASLGGLLNLSRLRQNSEPNQMRHSNIHPPLPGTPISVGSKSHSFTIARESLVIPERQEGDNPAKYLIRLEESVSRGVVATLLSQSNDDFLKNVMRSYMRGFNFFGDPLDMSIRKLLMEVELPKETQQIDRVLQAFANRYHECNPGIYASPDEAYFIAFSVLILHTDVFNKNNKNKMQKNDYTKNARGQGVADEILECFYDNISYTPFIHVEDDVDVNGERVSTAKFRKSFFTKQSTDSVGRPLREPVDPYSLILDNRLDSLRPSLKDVMNVEEHYTYHGTAPSSSQANIRRSFFKYGILQILSSRSRPDAFTSPETMANPAEAHPGLVDIKVTKVGILWRKDTKKKKTRSPWHEWGAILTGSQLYFFRNSGWVKSLMDQHDSHLRHGLKGAPVIFRPPLEQFKPDVLMSTEDAVALQDTSYKKHKNALVFVRHGGLEEVFLADNESELNDWLAKLNYAATFRTASVRIRGTAASSNESKKRYTARRTDSDLNTPSSETSSVETAVQEPIPDSALARQIQFARHQIMVQKIREADDRLAEAGKLLDIELRNARHLQILAPIQNRTREQIILAAGRMSAKIKWTRIDMWRTKCHRDILAMDLEDELRIENNLAPLESTAASLPQVDLPAGLGSRKNEKRGSYSGTPRAKQLTDGDARPATQPSPTRPFDLDNVFESLPREPSTSTRKGSWELPPLSFQSTKTSLKSNQSPKALQSNQQSLAPQSSMQSVYDTAKLTEVSDRATELALPTSSVEHKEQEVPEELDVITSESPNIANSRRPQSPNSSREGDVRHINSPEADAGETKTKLRRSLQRTLRDSNYPPSHHRSKKGKDSGSSATIGDGSSTKNSSEGLPRGTGSFKIHGKKASIINFGSEWQAVSPEERLKLRREAQNDDSRLSVPFTVEDEKSSLRSISNRRPRPISAVSASSTTNSTTAFEEASEEPVLETHPSLELQQAAGSEIT